MSAETPSLQQASQARPFRAALAVHQVTRDVDDNLAQILLMIDQAAHAGCDLVLFAETAPTGLINSDDPEHDLPLGCEIPGPATDQVALRCRERGIWTAIGLLEREGQTLYDTAVLLSSSGEIRLKYRRIQPQWHGRKADPCIYREGTSLDGVQTPLGSFAFAICGDLFDDGIVERIRAAAPDWLLFPFARCFSEGAWDQGRWDREEMPHYVARVRPVGATTLMTNYLAHTEFLGGAFGGAHVVAPDGEVMHSLPLGRAGLLVVDLPSPWPSVTRRSSCTYRPAGRCQRLESQT